jgi:type IV secretory pathway VirB4 component
MIDIRIKTDSDNILDQITTKDITMQEVALTIYVMERLKKELLNKEFEDELLYQDDGEDI